MSTSSGASRKRILAFSWSWRSSRSTPSQSSVCTPPERPTMKATPAYSRDPLIARVGELAISGSREYAGEAFIVGRSGGVQPDDWIGVEREQRQLHKNDK